jgi:hypothetical protein
MTGTMRPTTARRASSLGIGISISPRPCWSSVRRYADIENQFSRANDPAAGTAARSPLDQVDAGQLAAARQREQLAAAIAEREALALDQVDADQLVAAIAEQPAARPPPRDRSTDRGAADLAHQVRAERDLAEPRRQPHGRPLGPAALAAPPAQAQAWGGGGTATGGGAGGGSYRGGETSPEPLVELEQRAAPTWRRARSRTRSPSRPGRPAAR